MMNDHFGNKCQKCNNLTLMKKKKIAIVPKSKTMANAGTKLSLRTKIAAVFKCLNNMFVSSFLYKFGNKATYSN